ncbi:hypothetical protein NBRC10512_007224 [Rhodotorula toruloides]|uniref:RHTO0S15e02256g1_1 n=2 Tax=Rhodotorula toruloides TaxID=5286 RepID=A0A061BCX4_RHOTO|nr:zinc finger, RING-type domain containing protein [Rhodotorula toruloides NP11]EMS25476.1 zinc finger, RING-type domain containing protein [Rhodotorula toruloides NP11]CDR47807.1 RHTO0S15e02256g1_1 [Rhodotorula toruloides]
MLEDEGQATALSPLDWIACTSCRTDCSSSSLNPGDFYLSTCGHTLCHACIASSTSQNAQSDERPCPACGTFGPVVRLDQASDLQPCFRPLSDLVGELSMAAEWQVGNLVEQLRFFKAKCAEQKKMLARVGAELKKVKGIKAQAEQLAAENARLKTQLAQAQEQRFSTAQDYAAQQYAAQGRPSAAPTPRGQKRKAEFSPDDRSALPLRPATHLSNLPHPPSHPLPPSTAHPPRSASSASHSLPNGPQRLSLTPRSQREASERVRRRVGESLSGSVGGSASASASGDKRREESAREKLARFAYNPSASGSRASHRPPPTPTHAHAHHAAANEDPSPFQFKPPALLEREREREREREEMPPPPLPVPFGHAQGGARGSHGGWAGTDDDRGGRRVGTPFAPISTSTSFRPSSSYQPPQPPPTSTPAPPRFSLSSTRPAVPGTPRPFVPTRSGVGSSFGGGGGGGVGRFG